MNRTAKRYRYTILIDRDGVETRDERRDQNEAQQAYHEYVANAQRDTRTFSITLLDYDQVIKQWEAT